MAGGQTQRFKSVMFSQESHVRLNGSFNTATGDVRYSKNVILLSTLINLNNHIVCVYCQFQIYIFIAPTSSLRVKQIIFVNAL